MLCSFYDVPSLSLLSYACQCYNCLPADVRNDFYVTVNQGDFGQGRLSDRNVEISMQVCSRDGRPLGVSRVCLIITAFLWPQTSFPEP